MAGINLLPDLVQNSNPSPISGGINLLPDLVNQSNQEVSSLQTPQAPPSLENMSTKDVLRDVGGAAAGQFQKIASGLGEAGQYIGDNPVTRYINQNYIPESMKVVPDVNVREEMGLGQNNPVDLQKMIQSKNPNPVASVIGQVVPGVMSGGRTLLGQVAANTATDVAAASPEQENGFGILPNGRTGALAEDLALAGAGVAGGKVIGKGLSAVQKYGTDLYKKINPVHLAEQVQNGHDLLFNQSTKLFNTVKNEAVARNINIPMDKKLIDQASKYLAKTKQNADILARAKAGDYSAIHDLQSDLGTMGVKAASQDLQAERNLGKEMLDLRKNINSNTHAFFKNNGYQDLSQILNEANSKFTKLNDIYYKYSPINRLVNPDLRKIPTNPMNLLGENSKPMKTLLNEHPDIKKAVEIYKLRSKIFKGAYKGIVLTGATGGAIFGAPYIYNLAKNI